MSKYDDVEVGTLTRADLTEALRVNRALMIAAQGDIDYCEARVARERELIQHHETRIVEHQNDARSAPERLIKIRDRIIRQEKQLEELCARDGVRVSTTRPSQKSLREQRIDELTRRIVGGDMTAIAEMTKLASQK